MECEKLYMDLYEKKKKIKTGFWFDRTNFCKLLHRIMKYVLF